ncbi:MAG: carbamoyltransferase HypF [Nitrospirae bacterium]|nr:MAG: carbamoyltransferase HypF [Nitrospirota bacterium]
MERLNITVKGIVQGVGFRPFVYNLATRMGLKGHVTNTAAGVEIEVEGEQVEGFTERLRAEAPPLAKILGIEVSRLDCSGAAEFVIRESTDDGRYTLISPDISVCPDCLAELRDPHDRRYAYPFINCTNCGPRYSITLSVPYDRPNTTMRSFTMCPACEAEYRDPADRRFHAQPNACPVCGPAVSLVDAAGEMLGGGEPVAGAVRLLKEGKVLAIKGLGGFHLACDALNADAVATLRQRKRKNNKPFALMAPDLQTIGTFCHLTERDRELLLSEKRPIVLLRKKEDCSLPEAVSPQNNHIGFMLPYTPLHYLLFSSADASPGRPCFDALVMTSGNLAEEPLVRLNDEARAKLSGIADAFLMHDRDIFMRVDDTVMKVSQHRDGGVPSFIRRSRGYVPEPVALKDDGPDVMGCGADLKNTFCLTRGGYAIVSQHIGDMENYETLQFYEESLKNLKAVYRAEPVAIVHDLHPGYLSTRWALGQTQAELHALQHHYAHIGSVMAEKGITGKVIGIAFDGSGYGDDGSLWGGEFLIAGIDGFKRAGHIMPVPLPGGETAIREPWRTAISYLKAAAGDEAAHYCAEAGLVERYGETAVQNILKISDQRQFSPLSSGAGRLFDAAAALIGVCDRNTFEGEAAMALEAIAADGIGEQYPVDIRFSDLMLIDFSMTFFAMIKDLKNGLPKGVISAKFHNTVAAAAAHVAVKLSATYNIRKVALSGGVFQNSCLLGKVIENLRPEWLDLYINEIVPCNDAGISLGQAYIIRERIKAGIRK